MSNSPVDQLEAFRGERASATDGLARVSPSAVGKLEEKCGPLPRDYVNLLTTFGAGRLVLTEGEEPVVHTLLAPRDVLKTRKALASWLSAESVNTARERQQLDVARLIPFLSAADGTTWVVLAGQKAADNRVFVFAHDWEQRADLDVFAGPHTLAVFFDRYLSLARRGEPLNGSQAHRVLFAAGGKYRAARR